MHSELFKDLGNSPRPTYTMIGLGQQTGGVLPHFHSTSELIYLLKGRFSIATPNSLYPVSAGDIVLTSSGTPHSTVDTIPPVEFIVCYLKFTNYFDESNITKHLFSYHSSKQNIVHIFKAGTPQNQFIGNIMEKLLYEQTNKKEHHKEMIEAYLSLINSFLIREKVLPEKLSNIDYRCLKRVLPILDYINNNYHSPCSVKEISSLFFLSRSHFEKVFKLATDMNYTEYINYVRLQNSKKLIKDTSKTIAEIAREVGFSSQAYFCRCFKKFYLCTPNEYRQGNKTASTQKI